MLLYHRSHPDQISKAHRQKQIECDKLTQGRLLRALLGEVSKEEIDRHYLFSTGYYKNNRIDTTVLNWYRRLIEANDRKGIYDKKRFRRYVYRVIIPSPGLPPEPSSSRTAGWPWSTVGSSATTSSPAGTAFQQRVWRELVQVPFGETVSYGALAKAAGCGSPRAVGQAVHNNPIAILIPCHRVIGANGSLTGFAGGLDTKRRLLTLGDAPPGAGGAKLLPVGIDRVCGGADGIWAGR